MIDETSSPAVPGRVPTVTEAVRALRLALGDTQQQFAQRLGLAISTVVRYESTRAPRGKALTKIVSLAEENGLGHIAKMFGDALMNEAGLKVEMRELTDKLLADEDLLKEHKELTEGRTFLKLAALHFRLARLSLTLIDTQRRPKARLENATEEVRALREELEAWMITLPSPEQKIDYLLRKKLEQYPEMTPEKAFAEIVATDWHDEDFSSEEFSLFVKQGLPPLFEIQSCTIDPPKVKAVFLGLEEHEQAQPKKRA